jgi:phosphonoacetaldehyde hydrolase
MKEETANKISLVIFDWAGTTIDFGSRAPAAAFAGVFAANGIEVTDQQARAPMGLNKRDHLRTMLSDPPVAEKWRAKHARDWTETDVDTMYEAFVPIQLQAIQEHAELVPGLMAVVNELRERQIQIGGTTGYFRAAADAVAIRADEAGFRPDANVCADDVPAGRPAPWMIYRVMKELQVSGPTSVLKIGDTIADIQAGLAAGCWSIGVCDSSSLIGLSRAEFEALAESERDVLLVKAEQAFRDAGAQHVVRTLSDLPALIDTINAQALSNSKTI